MIARMVFWHSDANGGQRIALLCRETSKAVFLVMLREGYGVVLRRVPKEERTKSGRMVPIKLRPALDGGQDYSPRKGRAHYRKLGRTAGITKGAEQALKEVTV